MLVAPPGHLKTTAAEVLGEFPKTIVISNLTVGTLTSMRDEFLGSNIHTLIFSDYSAVHKRHGSVASNIEGVVMALAGEGFRKPGFSDQRVQALPARCTIIGCMTPRFSESMEGDWIDSGFYRRFLWCRYIVKDPEFIDEALWKWRKASLDGDFSARIPVTRTIPYSLDPQDVAQVRHSLRYVRDTKISSILAQKIVSVLKWKFARKDPLLPMRIWNDFAPSLSKDGTTLIVKEDK